MKLLLLLAHSIEEHDQLRLLAGAGYDVFSLGGYIDPAHPHDPKRPALPDVPRHPELAAIVDGLGTPDNLTAAKERIPDELLDWADVIICHHYEHRWIVPQWDRIRHKRVIWRTVGQSVEHNERMMAPLRSQGLEIVRYSPREANIPGYAGSDALIRFYKDPAEWCGWTGEQAHVINITQHLYQRDPYTNWRYWEAATKGLPRLAMGPGSEAIGGPGELGYSEMLAALRSARVYLYTGTQPASYTLGLIEAMMTGTPVIPIGRGWMDLFAYSPELFEAPDILGRSYDNPDEARDVLAAFLREPTLARIYSSYGRARAIELFGMATIAQQWAAYLGGVAELPEPVTVSA